MIPLVFTTANENKVKEIRALLPATIKLLGLNDINCHEHIPETQDTIEGNAAQKAFYVFEKYGYNCFSDDTGLLVDALDGMPGVLSARYAGEAKNANANMDKLLQELKGNTNRAAQFKTIISLVMDGEEIQFEGIVEGTITEEKKGSRGFGYDPVFLPNGSDRTFAEMDITEKNKISHRGIAVKKLVAYLKGL